MIPSHIYTSKEYRFQVAAFQAFFRAAKIGGEDNITALIMATVKTSDDAMRGVQEEGVDKWFEEYGSWSRHKSDHVPNAELRSY